MNLLLEEITLEKMRPQSELGYIQRVQQMADKSDSLLFSHFVGTGRIYPRGSYLTKYKKRRSSVHKDTQLVVVYMLGVKIDRLFDGTYCYTEDGKEMIEKGSKKLERILYEKVCNKNSTKVAQLNNI
tara:strand:+ start:5255 stop:5635 length:381 start_codon:yes stop_codon:yes gene_type:complete